MSAGPENSPPNCGARTVGPPAPSRSAASPRAASAGPPRIDALGLQNISQAVTASMASIQQQLATELEPSGNSAADMVEVQYSMANYTRAAQTLSSIMKDMSGTLKSVVQHIS